MSGFPIQDAGANTPPLTVYKFTGVGGIATLTGFFVRLSGRQIGNFVTLTIPAAAGGVKGVGFADVSGGGGIPGGAVGFHGELTGADIYTSHAGVESDDAVPTYEDLGPGYPKFAQAKYVVFGRSAL